MARSFIISGVDLSSYVVDWAEIEQVKEVLLAKATLFVGEVQIQMANSKGQFSPDRIGSFLKGRSLFNIPCSISVDGGLLFSGFLKDVKCDHASRVAEFTIQNLFSKPADSFVSPYLQFGVNPVTAMLTIFSNAGLVDSMDVASFLSAAGQSSAAGATVDVNFTANSNQTVLSAIQTLSEIASVSVYVQGSVIRAKPFVAYQGSESNLKAELNPSVVRGFKSRETAWTNFNNKVTVLYGASLTYSNQDALSIATTGVTRLFTFNNPTGSVIAIPNLVSATYFGNLYLTRAGKPPRVISCEVGKAFFNDEIGSRYPVTAPNWGFVREPFELIEAHRMVKENATQLVLRSLT